MVEDTNNSSSPDETEEVKDEVSESETTEDASSGKDKPDRDYQARIDELHGQLKETREELARLREDKKTPPPPPSVDVTEQDRKAIEYLKKLGFSRKEELEDKVKAIEDRLALDTEHNRLATAYDGQDGRPRYDKSKVEEYMRTHAVYDPEIAYKALHETELLDWHAKKAKSGTDNKPYIEKPGNSSATRQDANAITREKLQEITANPTPANRTWYEKNRLKILQMMAEGQL